MPCFLLSHRHAPDTDGLVDELFEDLSARVREATGAERTEIVGHKQRSDRLPGPPAALVREKDAAIAKRIATEVAVCTVLVPLYSPRYFKSPSCGRVVSAFVGKHPSPTTEPLIAPVLWAPSVRSWPPVPAVPAEVNGADRYNRHGLLDVMMSRGDADARGCYDVVLDALTAQVVLLAGRASESPPGPVGNINRQPNAFARPAAFPRVSIHVLAPVIGRMPAGRDRDQYGATSLDWNPFLDEETEGLGRRMETMAGDLGYRPVLTAMDDAILDLPGGGPPTGPAILLVDPWALDHPKWRDQLHEFDQLDRPWVSVMAAWDLNDQQTAHARHRLLRQLNSTLESRFQRRRPGLHLDAHVASTLANLGRTFPIVLQEATRRYLRWMSGRWRP
jgi:FxsC-like protein